MDLDERQFWDFMKEFLPETDRAAVVLAAARVDFTLKDILQNSLVSSPAQSDDLFGRGGPIASFSAKIDLAHRLGLIDNTFAKALHLLRRMRNDFAHQPGGSTLQMSPNSDRLREFLHPFRVLKEFVEFPRPGPPDSDKTPGSEFRAAVASILIRLDVLRSARPNVTYYAPIGLEGPTVDPKQSS
jgi:hypothetical protein